MTARMDASVTYTQTWDAQNRLGSVTAPGKDTGWTYDADGARAIKVSGPITTVYIAGSVEVQISGTLRLTTTYYFFGGARSAMRVGETVTYLHGDRLGSASLATDAAGNVLSQERYYVWGSASMMSGTMPTDFQWQNQRRLDEAQAGKLYDFNARFFTPVAARFVSPDSIVPNPADPQSLNRYTAIANNPLKFVDPTGQLQISAPYESSSGIVGPVRPPAPWWTAPRKPWAWTLSPRPAPARTRVVQVSLATFQRRNQYAQAITSNPRLGQNTCGLVAASAPTGDWLPYVQKFADAAGDDYTADGGIQPSKYEKAVKAVLGSQNVTSFSNGSIEDIYDRLAAGKVVIVDIRVGSYHQTDPANKEAPSASPPNYAHFARVLGVDYQTKEIYIENTLAGQDAPYWTVSFSEFGAVWATPETGISLGPPPGVQREGVTNWALVINPSAYGR